jgi:cell shape-determining protein MreC
MKDSPNNGTLRVLAACLLAAAMFAVLPASATMPVRDLIRTAVSPGQRFVTWTASAAQSRWQRLVDGKLTEHQKKIEELHAEVELRRLRERRAQLAAEFTAQALADVERHGATPFAVETAPSLIRPRAVRATVLGREILSELKSRRILDRGQSHGVASDLWVLNGNHPIVQAGSELNVTDGLPVFAGRCIVGRIVESGRWTSSMQFLTEPGFRARAVLARSVPNDLNAAGVSFGSEGMVEGRSDLDSQGLCELSQISATEHVELGMSVYSPASHAVNTPMLFGQVASAELSPGALHWNITVRPAVDLSRLRAVEIVVPEVNTVFETPFSEEPVQRSQDQALPTGSTSQSRELSDRSGSSPHRERRNPEPGDSAS